MKIVGIIAEYNPFHNGHEYHINQALEITGADAAIVVMSGDFVQRGTPAIMPKHLRAQMALNSGASVVIELPVPYATGSAEYFAYGAISLMEQLGCVDALCFGSECADLSTLSTLAKLFVDEPADFKNLLSNYLKQGYSFPLSRQYAVRDYLQSEHMTEIISQPNNILGIEYLKALYRLDSSIEPYTIQRISSHYHDQELQETFSSASAIRRSIQENALNELDTQLSSKNLSILKEAYHKQFPIYANDFSLLLKYKLMQESKETLLSYADVSEEIANRIYNSLDQFHSFEQFCELLKTKELTYARISRALLHILLGIKNEASVPVKYARILGFRKTDSNVLTVMSKQSSIPLITKLTAYTELEELQIDIKSSDLYHSVLTDKFKTSFQSEYVKQLILFR